MRRWSLVALATLACTPDTERLAAPASDPRTSVATPATAARVHVRGDALDLLYGGDQLGRVSFSAHAVRGGQAGGEIALQLGPARRADGAVAAHRPVRFEVTCLEVSGNRAWIGGRLSGPDAAPDAGGDVWYVEDGGLGGVDRAGVWIGHAPGACRTRPVVTWALPVGRGDLVVSVE